MSSSPRRSMEKSIVLADVADEEIVLLPQAAGEGVVMILRHRRGVENDELDVAGRKRWS